MDQEYNSSMEESEAQTTTKLFSRMQERSFLNWKIPFRQHLNSVHKFNINLEDVDSHQESTLALRELSPQEIEDVEVKYLWDSIRDLSTEHCFVATIEESLTGTVIDRPLFNFRLDELLSTEDHSDIYSVSENLSGDWNSYSTHQAHVYVLDGLPTRTVNYRRRDMKRRLRSSAWGPYNQDGRTFIICPRAAQNTCSSSNVNRSVSGTAIKVTNAKESARIKQKMRRQRNRARDKELTSWDTICPLTQYDKNLKILKDIFDADNPLNCTHPSTDEEWESILASSKSLYLASDKAVFDMTFENVSKMLTYVQSKQKELFNLKMLLTGLPQLKTTLLERPSANPTSQEGLCTEMHMFEYVSRLIPKLIEGIDTQILCLDVRLEVAEQERTNLFEAYKDDIVLQSLLKERSQLLYDKRTYVEGSSAWTKADIQLKVVGHRIAKKKAQLGFGDKANKALSRMQMALGHNSDVLYEWFYGGNPDEGETSQK